MGRYSDREVKGMPWHEQVRESERHGNGIDARRHLISEAQRKGSKVTECGNIKEAIEAKSHYEAEGKRAAIVGGTSKPLVVFK